MYRARDSPARDPSRPGQERVWRPRGSARVGWHGDSGGCGAFATCPMLWPMLLLKMLPGDGSCGSTCASRSSCQFVSPVYSPRSGTSGACNRICSGRSHKTAVASTVPTLSPAPGGSVALPRQPSSQRRLPVAAASGAAGEQGPPAGKRRAAQGHPCALRRFLQVSARTRRPREASVPRRG